MKLLRLLTIKRNILLVTCIAIVACNNNNRSLSPRSGDGRDDESLQEAGEPGNFLKFVQHKVMDRQATGKRAINYLIPEGWTVNDSLFWVYTDPNVPIRYAAACESRDRSQKIEIYPDYRETWSRGMMRTQGQKPPSDIIAGLKWIINAAERD
jgi:hypothetical protein